MIKTLKIPRPRPSILFALILVASFSILLGAVSPALAQSDLPGLIKKAESSIVVILTYTEEGDHLGQGTGFFIDKNGIITTVAGGGSVYPGDGGAATNAQAGTHRLLRASADCVAGPWPSSWRYRRMRWRSTASRASLLTVSY